MELTSVQIKELALYYRKVQEPGDLIANLVTDYMRITYIIRAFYFSERSIKEQRQEIEVTNGMSHRSFLKKTEWIFKLDGAETCYKALYGNS